MIIKVLGPGCTNCKNLERVTRQAVDGLGVDATIEKVTDYPTVTGYGVMATPALPGHACGSAPPLIGFLLSRAENGRHFSAQPTPAAMRG